MIRERERERRKWHFRSKTTSKLVAGGREVRSVKHYATVKAGEDQGVFSGFDS